MESRPRGADAGVRQSVGEPTSTIASSRPTLTAGRLSIRQRLSLIVLVVAIPLLLLSAGIVWRLAERERDLGRQAIMYSAHSILSAVDAQLGKYIAVAEVLAASPSLQQGDLAAFRNEARGALAAASGTAIALADPGGRQVVNTYAPPGQDLPLLPPEGMAAQTRALETGLPQVTDQAVGPVTKIPVIAVIVPVFRGRTPVYGLSIAVDVTVFRDLINSQRLPDGWLVGIIDRSGRFVARSLDHDRWVGRPASQGWRTVKDQHGWFEITSLEGEIYTTANLVSSASGWSLGAAAKKDVFEAPIRQTVVFANLAGLAVIALSIMLAASVARRITAPIAALAAGARALRHHQPVSFAPTDVPEVDRALQAFQTASRELRENEEQRVKSETALFHASRLSEIGQMAAALAHELNQPLTAVTSYIGGCRRILRAGLGEEECRARLNEIMELTNAQALRAGEIIRRLREFVGTGQTERTVESAAEVMREASTLAIAAARHNGVAIRSDIDTPGHVLVNKVQIQQVVVNLVRNAVEAMEETPRKELGIDLALKGERVELSVSDTGTGLAPEMADRLFSPFSSTKSQGMGIGLSVCREIVEAHDGKIWAEPNPDGGSVFRFTLPLVSEEMIARAQS